MSFSYGPLELHYSYSFTFRNEDIDKLCQKHNKNEFQIVKDNVVEILDAISKRLKACTYCTYMTFGLNPDCWYIYKLKRDETKSYYYIFGVKWIIVASFNLQVEYTKNSNDIYYFLESQYKTFNDINIEEIKVEYKKNKNIDEIENATDIYKIFDDFKSLTDQVREKEKNDKIKRRRFYTIDEIEKYKEIISSTKSIDNIEPKTKNYLLCDYVVKEYY